MFVSRLTMQKQTPPARLYRCFSVARASITGALLGGFALVGCSELTVVQTPPVQLTDKVYGFACSHWANSAPPPVARTLFDLRLWQESTETQPAPALVAAIEGAGGRVVYSFHGPMIRAELDVAAVPTLYGAGSALNYAATVTDPGAHDVTLIVMLNHDLTDKDLNAAPAVG